MQGLTEMNATHLVAVRGNGFTSIDDFSRRSTFPGRAMRALADADAFRSIGVDRRNALWHVRRLPDDAPLPLFQAADAHELGREPDAFTSLSVARPDARNSELNAPTATLQLLRLLADEISGWKFQDITISSNWVQLAWNDYGAKRLRSPETSSQ